MRVTHPRPIGARARPVSGAALAWLGVLAFSMSTPMTKIALRDLDPVVVSLGRAAVASVLAGACLLARRASLPTAPQIRQVVAVAGGVVLGSPLLAAIALRHTDSAHGSIILGLTPLATAGLAVARAGERPSALYWLAGGCGIVAVSAFTMRSGGGSWRAADALLFLAVVAAAVGFAEGALLARQMPAWQVISWALVLSAPVAWVGAALTVAKTRLTAPAEDWLAFSYVASVSMFLAFFAFYAGLARLGIARGSQLQLAQPALAITWGWPMLGERLTPEAVATVVIVLFAVAAGRRATVNPGSRRAQ